MGLAKGNARERDANIRTNLGVLAYDRLKLVRELEELDKQIATLETMSQATDQVLRDLDTEEAVNAAKEEIKED